MKVKKIVHVLRQGGYFYYNGQKIKAHHHGDGYGVDMILEVSPLDVDFGLPPELYEALQGVEFHLFINYEEYEDIGRKLKESDELTYQLLGHGWASGPRPYQKLHEFM